jgi:hypothetical protein
MRGVRRALLAWMAIACAVAAIAVAEDSVIPVVDKLNVTPHTICLPGSNRCAKPGGTVTFRISEFAQVRAATRPLGQTKGPLILFKRNFQKGKHSRHFSLPKGVQTGKWDMQITAIDKSNNASHPADRTYRVIK